MQVQEEGLHEAGGVEEVDLGIDEIEYKHCKSFITPVEPRSEVQLAILDKFHKS